LVTSCAIHGWDPCIGSVNSLHATPTEYTKCRQALVSGIQARYQQTPEYAIQVHSLVAPTRAQFNPVGATCDRLTNAAKSPWR
jgi:hypothetical protein